jgi:hypothetical protein
MGFAKPFDKNTNMPPSGEQRISPNAKRLFGLDEPVHSERHKLDFAKALSDDVCKSRKDDKQGKINKVFSPFILFPNINY